MNENFKKEFMMVTGKAEPDLDEILNSSFTVFKRMDELNPKNGIASVTLATNSYAEHSKPKSGCVLCSYLNLENSLTHKLSNCPKFLTPSEKVNKIKELNGCVRCGTRVPEPCFERLQMEFFL